MGWVDSGRCLDGFLVPAGSSNSRRFGTPVHVCQPPLNVAAAVERARARLGRLWPLTTLTPVAQRVHRQSRELGDLRSGQIVLAERHTRIGGFHEIAAVAVRGCTG